MPTPSDWIHAAVTRYERPLIAYAIGLLGGPAAVEAARDAVQDTFLQLCHQPREQVEGHLSAWLFAVCRNRCMDVHRRAGREDPMPEAALPALAATAADPSAPLCAEDEHARVRRAMSQLDPGRQEVIRLKFHQGLSYAEISAITGHSVAMVGYLIHTALTQLRGALGAAA